MHCIGATTYDEYIKIVEKEKAIERRFQLIKLEEPDTTKTYEILKGIKTDYEKFHNITISDEVCAKIVKLCEKYVVDRYFPDKAIDILDCSSVLAKKKGMNYLDEKSVIDTIENLHNVEINKSIIKDNLINQLTSKVIGQNEAIEKVVNRLSYIEKGLVDDNKPLGIFFFTGPSGVGKTELAKQIAKYYFGSKESCIKIDMSEFKEAHSISKLIGTAPGYVGYENQTLIIDKIRKKPHSVIILDEIEKAHKDVINIFLNVFDEGCFYDSRKRKIDFTNSVIIMTSNLGSGTNDNIGFVNSKDDKKDILKAVKNHFTPEFLNRIDDIICFESLDKESVTKITNNYLEEYSRKFDFEFDKENIINEIIKNEDIKIYGARYIKRELKKNIIKRIENKVEVNQ